MDHNPLLQPVGALLRPIKPLDSAASLRVAAEHLRSSGGPALPVVQGGMLVGMIRENDLATALASGADPHEPCLVALAPMAPRVDTSATGSEALRLLEESGSPLLLVIDVDGRAVGTLCASDLLARNRINVRPRTVGGMATPFGVYLTNGAVHGGVGNFALAATGALLFTVAMVGGLMTAILERWIGTGLIPPEVLGPMMNVFATAIFLGAVRAMPLAGTHAAEHMTVHAIERGEDLVPEIVARMPRVHPRCGTNIAAGGALFFGVANLGLIGDFQLRLLLAVVVTLALWQPLGSFLQKYFTTKPPTPGQIESGIAAGKELLARFASSPIAVPSVGRRILYSGLLQIMLGSMAAYWVWHAIALLLKLPPEWMVYF